MLQKIFPLVFLDSSSSLSHVVRASSAKTPINTPSADVLTIETAPLPAGEVELLAIEEVVLPGRELDEVGGAVEELLLLLSVVAIVLLSVVVIVLLVRAVEVWIVSRVDVSLMMVESVVMGRELCFQ